jgi:hypothetical protein
MNRENADDITTDLKKFPSLEEYVDGLSRLTIMNLSNLNIQEIEKSFYERAILFQQVVGVNPSTSFNQHEFYRVRMNVSPEEDEDLIRTYSYPPISACKKNGRANLTGRSVFYCSDHAGTALLESKPEPGQTGYLSIWRGSTFRDIKYGVCLNTELKRGNPYLVMADTINKLVKEESIKKAGGKAEHFIQFYNFIAERFINEDYPYSLTSFIANEMLYEGKWKDFIIYPSVANDRYGCNMAFHPNSVDTVLKFIKVLKFKFLSKGESLIGLSDLVIGELNRTRMSWRKPYAGELKEIMPWGNYV